MSGVGIMGVRLFHSIRIPLELLEKRLLLVVKQYGE